MVLMLREEMAQAGIPVWIDLEQLTQTTEVLMNAIQNCSIIVSCVSRNYQINAPSRLELEFGIQARRPILPVVVEQGFQSQGWLKGIIGEGPFRHHVSAGELQKFKDVVRDLQKPKYPWFNNVPVAIVNRDEEKEPDVRGVLTVGAHVPESQGSVPNPPSSQPQGPPPPVQNPARVFRTLTQDQTLSFLESNGFGEYRNKFEEQRWTGRSLTQMATIGSEMPPPDFYDFVAKVVCLPVGMSLSLCNFFGDIFNGEITPPDEVLKPVETLPVKDSKQEESNPALEESKET